MYIYIYENCAVPLMEGKEVIYIHVLLSDFIRCAFSKPWKGGDFFGDKAIKTSSDKKKKRHPNNGSKKAYGLPCTKLSRDTPTI